MRTELEAQGYPVHVLTVNAISAAGTVSSLVDACSFDVFQDTPAAGVWQLFGGGKDDIFIFREGGRLAPGGYLKVSGPVNTNLSTEDGYRNVRDRIIAAWGLGSGEPCVDCTDFQEEARIDLAEPGPFLTSAAVTLDGSGSSPGPGNPGALSFFWEIRSGPASIEGPDREASAVVRGIAGGEVLVRLTVGTEGQPCSAPSSAEQVLIFKNPDGSRIRCDSNGDRINDISDVIFTLTYLFTGGVVPPCPGSLDCNRDGKADIADAVYDLSYLFTGGPQPAPPYPGCEVFAGCATSCP